MTWLGLEKRWEPMVDRGNGDGPRSVLVVGGGVGGMRAAIDLAEAGIHTYLLETPPSLGGRGAQLGFMFPTHDCVLCRGTSDHGFGCTRPAISPTFLDHNLHPNLTLLTPPALLACEGDPGDFRVSLRRRPQYVDPSLCTNCGRCAEVCPEVRPSGFQLGLSTRKIVDKSAPRSIPNTFYILERAEHCAECGECAKVCPTGAIDLGAEPAALELHVGAVILALGFQPFNPVLMPELGFGRIPNVITSMQYERLASRSGPTEGIVRRISDGRVPRRLAWLQCVGSRDQRNPYCSSICCMYATKEAMLAMQRIPGAECHIFTMDERAFNKEYNQYYREARESFGIRYTRCRISDLQEDPATGEVILRFPGRRPPGQSAAGQGPLQEERFDLVVLAVGIRPPDDALQIAGKLGIELNEYGFCQTDKFSPLASSRPGVFVCGAFASPKEIAETILDASGAVALCDGAGEISRTVDMQALARFVEAQPGVGRVERLPLACLPAGQAAITD